MKRFIWLILFLVYSPWSMVHGPWSMVDGLAHAASKSTSVATRKWVVKLKQNSWMNRRPFQFATPVSDGKTVFVGVHREFFYAVDAKRGKKIWTFKTQGPIHAAARVDDHHVYFADTKGGVYALGKQTGEIVWVSKLEGEVVSAPLIHQDRLYLVTAFKELACLDLKSGNILWQVTSSYKDSGFTLKGASDPIFFGGHILVGYSDGTLVAHAKENGQIQWMKQLGDRFEAFHDVDATILVASESIAYVSSADGKLFALNPANGQIIWETPQGSVNEAVLAEPFLYSTAGGIVYCLNAETGQTLWEQNLEVAEVSSPAVFDKWLTVVATKGKVYFLDRQTGDIRHSWYVKGGSFADPIVSDKLILILSNASRLYAFQFK